ncbi:FRG domain-containing protein [Mucilaginibacter aquaedulcis]|uniref:FRG domain-containing protein n=1 Tax=Mucilaginibacter aquaedulcis TaxID=1187081 RepID=UPI0025B3FFD1|nr:FRG domain-containing protein [Mucilaginibacter aquaedulcis]MDN3550998.1 FRG domain-containing protein [Mucilaginibacter aquaedulcis]
MTPSLKELITQLNIQFSQEIVQLHYFDFKTLISPLSPQPRYLYRGEKTITWPTSMNTFSRNLKGHPDFREINHWVSGLQLETAVPLNRYALYPFLKYALWTTEEKRADPMVEIYINGIMQHYGFDTSLLDVSSDLLVAASFAATGSPRETGQIMVLETKYVEDEYFDLTDMFGNRAKLQSAYVLHGTSALDLKNADFTNQYHTTWHQFTLTQEDKDLYLNPNLLHASGDDVIPHILDWYDTHIVKNNDISDPVKAYFEKIISYLH